jgi:hypothetical protein
MGNLEKIYEDRTLPAKLYYAGRLVRLDAGATMPKRLR